MYETQTSALVQDGFDSWKRVVVHQGEKCAFLFYIGSSAYSVHNKCVVAAYALMKPANHIDKVIQRISREDVVKHRLRLKTTIMVVQELALRGSSFRDHDESQGSLNPGNVLAWISFAAKLNDQIRSVVLQNVPRNAKYTSPRIQKEILGIIANTVRRKIREEIGDSCFSILVDEAGREQMSVILRYVNSRGIVTERFFSLKSVAETSAIGFVSVAKAKLQELRNEGWDKLLQELSGALDPKSSFRSFNEENICELARDFYPQDFEEYVMHSLRNELRYYAAHVVHSQKYDVSSLAKLFEKLVETAMDIHFKLMSRLIHLVLTLPVSTATTERTFSAMKHLKTDLRNKMSDEFLADCLTIFFEREYVIGMDEDSIIDEFAKLKDRRVQLTL